MNAAVRAAEAQLAGRLSRPDLAALLRAVQEGEHDKLRFTLVLQVIGPINPADLQTLVCNLCPDDRFSTKFLKGLDNQEASQN